MTSFNDENVLKAIRAAVQAAEVKTAAEIVPVIAMRADNYRYIPLLYAMFLGLILPIPFIVFGMDWPVSAFGLYEGQLILTMIVATILQFSSLRIKLVPGYIKRRRAARMAREQFVEQRVHMTADHYGVLLFVAAAEHYVEILVDEGLAEKIDNQLWQKPISDFTNAVQRGQIAEGFTVAIADIGEALAEHAPANNADSNELSDRLVMLN